MLYNIQYIVSKFSPVRFNSQAFSETYWAQSFQNFLFCGLAVHVNHGTTLHTQQEKQVHSLTTLCFYIPFSLFLYHSPT